MQADRAPEARVVGRHHHRQPLRHEERERVVAQVVHQAEDLVGDRADLDADATPARLRAEAGRRGVGIEVCPISNQVLGLVDDLSNHPLALFVAEGLPVVVAPDDPGFWGAVGLHSLPLGF